MKVEYVALIGLVINGILAPGMGYLIAVSRRRDEQIEGILRHLATLNGRTGVVEARLNTYQDQCDERHKLLVGEVKTIHQRCFEVLTTAAKVAHKPLQGD